MVCESCEKRLTNLAVPDKWKGDKSSLSQASTSKLSIKAGKSNKILASLKSSAASYIPNEHMCRICKSKCLMNMSFCNDCAHKKGICAMCGKKVIDTSSHKMSLK